MNPPQASKPKLQTRTGFASWHVLVALAVVCAVLFWIQRREAANDVALATGPPSTVQREFFDRAAERPDLDLFFKGLRPAQRLQMARNLGDHETAPAAKAASRLLPTMDEAARSVLIESLSKIAIQDSALVAAQLGRNDSVERAGIFRALRAAGAKGIEAAATALDDPNRRANAIRFLAEEGDRAASKVLPMLAHERVETRSAAAEALGKMRSRLAVPSLLARLDHAQDPEREAVLTALADIGDVRAEGVLLDSLGERPTAAQSHLMAGLGRIATPTSLAALERYYGSATEQTREAALQALVLGGDKALRNVRRIELQLEIAQHLESEAAVDVIWRALQNPEMLSKAIEAAKGVEVLLPSLWPRGIRPDDPSVPARMEAMAELEAGRKWLETIAREPGFAGFAKRALKLAKPSSS